MLALHKRQDNERHNIISSYRSVTPKMSAEEVQLPTQSAPLSLPCSSPRPQVAAPPLLAAPAPVQSDHAPGLPPAQTDAEADDLMLR